MNTQLEVGESRQFPYGPTPERTTYMVTVTRDEEGISVYTQVGPNYNSTLSRTFTNAQLAEGRTFLAYLRDEAKAGKPVWLIEAGVSAVLAAAAIVDEADKTMVAGIRANMEQAKPKTVDVSDIEVDGRGWRNYRQAATRRAAITTEPMDRIIASAVDGYIPRSKDATSTQLVALKARGLVELDYRWHGRERRIAGAWLAGHKPSEVAA